MEKQKKTLKINLKTMILLVSIITILLIVSIIFISSYLKKNKNDSEKIVSEIEENTEFSENKRPDEIEYVGEDGILGVTIYKEAKTEFKLVNFKGETICNFGEFEYNNNINNNLILINKDNLYKVIDTKGNIIFEENNVSDAEIISNNNQDKFIIFEKNEMVKIINIETQEIISNYEYEEVSDSCITHELLKVRKDGKYGCIDKNGNVIINFEFEDLYGYYFLENMIVAKKDGKCGYIDKNGNVIINFEYDRLGFFSEGLISARKEDKIGFIDKEENIVIDFQYDYIYDKEHFVHLSYLWDMPQFKEDVALVFKDDSAFYIGKSGNTAIDFEVAFNIVDEDFKNGILVAQKNEKLGIVNKDGKVIVDFIYDQIQIFSGLTVLLLVKLGDKWGAIDKTGNTIIDFEFDDFLNFDSNYDNVIDEYIIAEKDNKYGCIDKTGKTLIEFKYDSLRETANDNLLLATNNQKIGFINLEGKTIIDFKYDKFSLYNTEFTINSKLDLTPNLLGAFRKGDAWDILDINGEIVGTYSINRLINNFRKGY